MGVSSAIRLIGKLAKLSDRIGKAWAKKQADAVDGKPITRKTPDWIRIEGRVYVGSTITDPGHFVLIPERVKAVRKAFQLAALGIGTKHIGHQLNGHGRSLRWITRTLSNREVLGEYTPKGCDPLPNYFPAIITQAEFDAVRAVVARKRRGGNTVFGNRCSDRADNRFSGLLFDVTEPEPVGLHFQRAASGSTYLRSDFRAGQEQHTCRYDKFEKVMLDFLVQQVDWKAVAGDAKSEPVKAAASELDKVLGELDRTNRLVENKTALIDDPDLDAATLKVFASQIAKAQAKLEELEEQKDTLSAKVQAAQAKTAPLYDSVRLIDLIEQNKTMLDVVSEGRADVNDIRLRLRTEIRQRFERIESILAVRFSRQS